MKIDDKKYSKGNHFLLKKLHSTSICQEKDTRLGKAILYARLFHFIENAYLNNQKNVPVSFLCNQQKNRYNFYGFSLNFGTEDSFYSRSKHEKFSSNSNPKNSAMKFSGNAVTYTQLFGTKNFMVRTIE